MEDLNTVTTDELEQLREILLLSDRNEYGRELLRLIEEALDARAEVEQLS